MNENELADAHSCLEHALYIIFNGTSAEYFESNECQVGVKTNKNMFLFF